MKIILIFITFVICLTGCKPKEAAVHASLPPVSQDKRWDYATFQFWNPEYLPNSKTRTFLTVLYIAGNDSNGKAIEKTNRCYFLSGLLNYIGKEGWEIVCFDGQQYIAKRESSHRGAFFDVKKELVDVDH